MANKNANRGVASMDASKRRESANKGDNARKGDSKNDHIEASQTGRKSRQR